MADRTEVKVLGFSGSLRQGSFNTAALRAALELVPAGMTIETFDLAPIPLYNEDVRRQGFPAPVEDFREKIRSADALLIVTPEYNYSVPGVLKNAIDWASRPPDQPFEGKPIAIMGASPGRLGTARAQYHLRQSFVSLNALLLNRPEVMIGGAAQMFDGGRLTDEPTREMVRKLLRSLLDWTRRHGQRERRLIVGQEAPRRARSTAWNVVGGSIGAACAHCSMIFAPFRRLHGAESCAGSGAGPAVVRCGAAKPEATVGRGCAPGQGSRSWEA